MGETLLTSALLDEYVHTHTHTIKGLLRLSLSCGETLTLVHLTEAPSDKSLLGGIALL